MGRTKKIIMELNNIPIEDNNLNNELNNNKCKKINNILTNNEDIITINDFKKKEIMYWEVLNKFFKNCSNNEITLMIDIIEGKHIISLRFLDWFVTRYCHLYKLSISIENTYNNENNFNINISYKAQLKSFRKRYFDPFRRKKKFVCVFEKLNSCLLSTLGQLNFFRWALSFDIIKYAHNNFKTINNKIRHVNSYFQKYTIDTNSLTLTSDENNISEINNSVLNTNSSSDTNSSNLNDSNQQCLNRKKIKPSKLFKNLLNSQSAIKYPQISRNISIEL